MTKPAEIAEGVKRGGGVAAVESVADILERETANLIQEWLDLVEKEPDLTRIPLSFEERTGHLPRLLHDVVKRLRLDSGTKAPISKAAADHGDLRRKQGYTVAATSGQHFYHAAQKRESLGIQRVASRRGDHRGRGGRAIERADAAFHGRGCCRKSQEQVKRYRWIEQDAAPRP